MLSDPAANGRNQPGGVSPYDSQWRVEKSRKIKDSTHLYGGAESELLIGRTYPLAALQTDKTCMTEHDRAWKLAQLCKTGSSAFTLRYHSA